MLYLDFVYEAGRAGMSGDWIYTVNYHKVPAFVYHICKWWMELEGGHPIAAWTIWIAVCILSIVLINYLIKDSIPEFRKLVENYKTSRRIKPARREVVTKEKS